MTENNFVSVKSYKCKKWQTIQSINACDSFLKNCLPHKNYSCTALKYHILKIIKQLCTLIISTIIQS